MTEMTIAPRKREGTRRREERDRTRVREEDAAVACEAAEDERAVHTIPRRRT